jgi:hypothetical protein
MLICGTQLVARRIDLLAAEQNSGHASDAAEGQMQ